MAQSRNTATDCRPFESCWIYDKIGQVRQAPVALVIHPTYSPAMIGHAIDIAMRITSRFAPSPTGDLHLGHAYSAWLGRQASDIWYLRFEDIDASRCRPGYIDSAIEDLTWLGLRWDGEIRKQSDHFPDYADALAKLQERGLIYPCFCTRSEIAQAQSAPHGAAALYPGTCRHLTEATRQQRMADGQAYALRLDTARACLETGALKFFDDTEWVTAAPQRLGDIVLARKDTPSSYHLCVVHDDALQGITHVIRGEDLREATHIQVLLQGLLGYETPVYRHHRLLLGTDGRRLAKRDKAQTLRSLRLNGADPFAILCQFGNAHGFG